MDYNMLASAKNTAKKQDQDGVENKPIKESEEQNEEEKENKEIEMTLAKSGVANE